MQTEEEREVFVELYNFYLVCKGSSCSEDYAKTKFSELNSFKRSVLTNVCNKLELHHVSKNELKEAIVISLIKEQEIWNNLNDDKFLFKVHDKYFSDQRLKEDEKMLEKFCRDGNISIEEVFRVPKFGQSLSCAFLRNLLITPRCFIKHLDVAIEGQNSNKKQVEMQNIISAYSKEVKDGNC